MIRSTFILAVGALTLAGCQDQAGSSGGARNEIRIVGSSTVFPFAKSVAERFAADGSNRTPILESTGTGAGISLFCSGVGADTPDIANASRRMKKSEFELCVTSGVKDIVEIQVGIDGIAIAESNSGPKFSLTEAQLYKAIAAKPFGKDNTTKTWKDVDGALPAIPITVYGPPSTSGTRDALTELIMEKGCLTDPAMKALQSSDEKSFKNICHEVRSDGPYVDAGENDNLIVQKLKANPNSIGIFGYSFLEENLDNVRGIPLNGVDPIYEKIASGQYPGARPLYIYLKKQHVGVVPGLQEYVTKFVADGAAKGPLASIGLIVAPEDIRAKMADAAKTLPLLTATEFE